MRSGLNPWWFYQPIGLFDPANEFVTDKARQTPGYALLASLDAAVRAEIARGGLKMIDLNGVLDPLEKGRYVDVSHTIRRRPTR